LPEFIKVLEKHIWLVVRDIKNHDGLKSYKLETQDIMKLGRMKFRIRISKAN